MKDVNQQLYDLYRSKWNELCDAMKPIIENEEWREATVTVKNGAKRQ